MIPIRAAARDRSGSYCARGSRPAPQGRSARTRERSYSGRENAGRRPGPRDRRRPAAESVGLAWNFSAAWRCTSRASSTDGRGAVAVVDSAFHHTHVSSEFPTFVVDESRLLPGFFRGIARSRAFWDQLDQTVRGSMVRRRRLSGSDFMRAQIWLPPLEHQIRVSREIDALDRLTERSGQCATRAAAIVPAILNREFTALA